MNERAAKWRANLPASLERLKRELDLPALVSQYAQLDDLDGYFTGPCPFHSDRDPSFQVAYSDRGWWCGCWTCGEPDPNHGYGDAIDFLQKAEDLPRAEAIERARELLKEGLVRVEREWVPGQVDLSTECASLRRGDDADRLVARFLADKPIAGADPAWLRREFRLAIRGGRLAVPNWSGPRVCSIKTRDPEAGWEWRAVKGSRHEELYGAWRDDPSRPLVICEGESDTWALATWFSSLSAVGVPGATKRPLPPWVERCRDRRVVLLFDPDKAGEEGAAKWREAVPHAVVARLPEGADARAAGRAAVLEAIRKTSS